MSDSRHGSDLETASREGMLFEVPERQAPELPRAERERFTPLRAGILNLWQYDEQELRFHQGRLLLRGENGTGKSKALEVLLPFLLDADLSPNRLDPFAGTARTMYWNLLEGERHDSRVGYVWIELGRLGADGEPVYWTIGCGLRATRRTRRVDSWYFVAPHRVGAGLALIGPDRRPLLKEDLKDLLTRTLEATDGGRGAVYDTGREYRERVDQLFYSLGDDRFAALRHLLLQLRRPQLSQKLDPASLSDLLAESLPPVDADLIGQLSEGFERLEEDERALGGVETAVRQLEGFLGIYRLYARGVARGRAAEVRGSDSLYHKTAGEMRDAEAARDELDGRLEQLGERQTELTRSVDRCRGALAALEQSEAMRSAEALRAKREHADDLERRAAEVAGDRQRAEIAVRERGAEREMAEGEAEEARSRRREQEHEARTAAGAAGIEAAHAAAVQALAEDPEAAEGTARAAVRARREAIDELDGLLADRDHARERWERREERRRDADEALRAESERAREAERTVTRAEEDLVETLAVWAAGLTELAPSEADLERLRDAALGAPKGTRHEENERDEETGNGAAVGLEAALGRLTAPARDALIRDRAALDAEARELREERRTVAADRERIEAAREVPPEPPRTREADRSGRPGAPFYRLVDFRGGPEGLSGSERAGLEAALEGSGLLDAWVTPAGELLAPGTLDTVVVPAVEAIPEEAPTLASALAADCPADSPPAVAAEVVDALLGSIALLPAGTEAGPPFRLGTDGTWRLGPLAGAWAKETPEHLGAAAREAARRRRLDTLDAQLADVDRRLEQTADARRTVGRRLVRLDDELAAAPSAEPLRRARARFAAVVEAEVRARQALTAAEEAAAAAHAELDAAERALSARARELDLVAHLDDLATLRDRLRDYELALSRLVGAWRSASAAVRRARAAAARADEAQDALRAVAHRTDEASHRAEAARAEYQTLEATVGREAREVIEEHHRKKERLGELEQEGGRLAATRETLVGERAAAVERVKLKAEQLADREGDREAAVERLHRLVATGLLELVLIDEGEPDDGDAATADVRAENRTRPWSLQWTLTRALELAREIERVTSDLDLSSEAADRRADRLHHRFHELMNDLGAEFQPSLRQEEELSVIRVIYNGAEHDPPTLLRLLRDNAATRRALLADHERELLRGFLLGEVGDHLRSRLRRSRELVDEMNKQLAEAPTASGMVLRLSWRAAGDAAHDVRRAVELLQKDVALLADSERRRLEGFLMSRIDEARQRWEAVPWREHLMAALDYRRWHRFAVLRKGPQDDGWQELTRRGHAAASGGEKAVALHLPLFAAAAAHYRSARAEAPRLVMLDEAFAGIDQGMRGRCMKLLVDFDLDFMMTSHDEWGCYEELPGLAIYQLYRDPSLDGVGSVRFVWSGGRLREEGST